MAGVYISYPFCEQKCTFCNFASGVHPANVRTHYERALIEEIEQHAWAWQPETAYLGGGTPSLMPSAFLRVLMAAIPRECLGEVTLECAPGTVSDEAAKAWRESGVNRVSLGVQSFVKAELRQTGRRHSAETVGSDIEKLRRAGIQNINIDLIAGLPEQTSASWNRSLDWIERLEVPHVSIYVLEVDEDSRMGKEVLLNGSRYGASLLPSDDLTAELYETAVGRLASLGLARYEISNFARPGSESRHNLKYWRREPYIGFGLDAHSFDGSKRWHNPDELSSYLNRTRAKEEQVTIADASEERFFIGLRLMKGIEPTTAEWERFARPIEKWVDAGMLERHGRTLRLSSQAVLISNEIFEEFVS